VSTHDTRYVLASEEGSYILYSPGPTLRMGLQGLEPGKYTLRWFDCRGGREVAQETALTGPEHSWAVPSAFGEDVALYLRKGEESGSAERDHAF
jgi:hypothetical protein